MIANISSTKTFTGGLSAMPRIIFLLLILLPRLWGFAEETNARPFDIFQIDLLYSNGTKTVSQHQKTIPIAVDRSRSKITYLERCNSVNSVIRSDVQGIEDTFHCAESHANLKFKLAESHFQTVDLSGKKMFWERLRLTQIMRYAD